jgi:hypothetical protein
MRKGNPEVIGVEEGEYHHVESQNNTEERK